MSNSAGSFLEGMAGGMGIGMQMKNMKQQNSNKPSNGLADGVAQGQAEMSRSIGQSDTGLMNIGSIGLPAPLNKASTEQAPSNGWTGAWSTIQNIYSKFGG